MREQGSTPDQRLGIDRPVLVLEWQVTMDQLQREMLASVRLRRMKWLLHRAAGLLCIAFGLWQFSAEYWFTSVFSILFGLWCLLFPYPYFWIGWLIAWAYYRSAPLPVVWFKVEFFDDGLRFRPWAPPGPPQYLHWSRLRSVEQDESQYMLSFTGDRWISVPHAAFTTPDDEQAFVALVERHSPSTALVAR
jgi:hypothetical protein